MSDEPRALRVTPCRAMVLSYCIVEGGTHECLLTYQDESQDDERELWRGEGLSHREAVDSAILAYFKWRDETDPDKS